MQEIEAKYFIRDLAKLEARILAEGGQRLHPRILETNLRFDTQNRDLSQHFQVLRLRQAHKVTMTYKGIALMLDGASQRQEIEIEVGDLDTARAMLEALGYQVVRTYEKYRTEYQLDGLTITLDELPYGEFVEIEGPGAAEIRQMAIRLGLDATANVQVNYLMLLDRVREARHLTFHDLTFENFKGLSITSQDLGVRPAD